MNKNKEEIREIVKQVVASVLEMAPSNLPENAGSETLEAWDSVAHMNIVMALEDEFKIQFTDQQMVELMNIDLIVLTIAEEG